MTLVLALLIGVIAGLRAMTAPAAVAWAAYLGWFDVSQTRLSFMGNPWTAWIFTIVAVGELISDQLPGTPSRKVPIQFATRIVSGALSGAVIGAADGLLVMGAIAGIIGAVIGTYGGAAARARLATSFGRDLPAALVEDVVAVVGALLIVAAVS
ncbi:DUF4126 family protein [Agrobacterium sp.]|uniref:DUF4126 family protein n=1 Tax=Agrobacterium sp. TaxID=361 RepID=UPI0028AD8F17|nr:DUF4126 family protein [Agrobacterium sp.]